MLGAGDQLLVLSGGRQAAAGCAIDMMCHGALSRKFQTPRTDCSLQRHSTAPVVVLQFHCTTTT
jgi:hypothetical protein